jgi:hypothetical protein
MNPEKIINGLTTAQADGLACVICGLDYLRSPGCSSVPVGRSASGSQVFACISSCAEAPGAESMLIRHRVRGGRR